MSRLLAVPVVSKPFVSSSGRFGDLGLVVERVSRYPLVLGIALVALATTSAATIGILYGSKQAIDHGFTADGGGSVAAAFHYLLIVVAVLAAATAIRFYCVSWLGERVVADIRMRVQVHLLGLAPRFFEANQSSEIASRLTTDTGLIESIVSSTAPMALRNAFTCVGGTIYLITLSPKLAGLLLLGIPIVMLPVMLLERRIRYLSRISQDRIADVGSLATQTLGAMKTVQAFGQESREMRSFTGAVEAAFAAMQQRVTLQAAMNAITVFLNVASITLVLWVGVTDVTAGRMSGGAITAFVLAGGIVAGAFGELTEVYGELLRGAGAAGRIAELLREQADIVRPDAPLSLPLAVTGALEFDAVCFRYPARPEVLVLENFTLAVRPGETVAVVGPSGAGKSTLFQLIERFYDPEGGRVLLDGVDLREADPAAIRAQIAMVPQDSVIFGASARDNLRYGRWEAHDDALWAAAEAANAADFLRALPQGLDTHLGEGGARLSGGQRQRVTIARALLRDAPILLLDEATSALDAQSERLVQEALERLMKNRTTLVIAHRFATVRAAERIIVMDAGRIVEEGTHTELIDRAGLYARLASLQFSTASLQN